MFCFITHPFSLPLSLEIPRNNVLQRNFNVTLFPYSSNKVYNLLKRESKDIQINWAESKKFIRFNKLKNITIDQPVDEIGLYNGEYYYFYRYSLYKYSSDDNVQNEIVVNYTDFPKQVVHEIGRASCRERVSFCV